MDFEIEDLSEITFNKDYVIKLFTQEPKLITPVDNTDLYVFTYEATRDSINDRFENDLHFNFNCCNYQWCSFASTFIVKKNGKKFPAGTIPGKPMYDFLNLRNYPYRPRKPQRNHNHKEQETS